MTNAQVPTEAAKRQIPPGVVLAFWLILLPLALAGLGIWQLDRSVEASRSVQANGQDMARALEEIRPIAAQAPGTMIRFEGGQSYPASMALWSSACVRPAALIRPMCGILTTPVPST